MKKNDTAPSEAPSGLEKDPSIYTRREVPPGSREKLIDAAARSAYNNNRAYEGCSRCVLAALNEHLHLTSSEGIKECIKASTALAAGVARMGETCGALTGGILALGLAAGSDRMELPEKYKETMALSYRLYDTFKERYGSTLCFEIQEKVLGRHYDFKNDEDAEAWYKDGGLEQCPTVCAVAAAMTAEIILNYKNTEDK